MNRNHFLFLKLTATEKVSMLHFDLLINDLDCISSRMHRRSPPPLPLLSYSYDTRTLRENCPKYGIMSDLYFPVFELNTAKYGPDITPYLDTFRAV